MSTNNPIARSIEEIRECVAFDAESGEYHVRVAFESVRPSMAAAAVLAAIRDEEVLELAPIGETVDPDAFNTVLGSLSGPGGVVVTVEGWQVAVTAPGTVWARPVPDGSGVWPGEE